MRFMIAPLIALTKARLTGVATIWFPSRRQEWLRGRLGPQAVACMPTSAWRALRRVKPSATGEPGQRRSGGGISREEGFQRKFGQRHVDRGAEYRYRADERHHSGAGAP